MSNDLQRRFIACGTLAVLITVPVPVHAAATQNQFGRQDRADAASRMILLGVQQAISSLPPTSGQAFTYQYDPETDGYSRTEVLGPAALRSPQTIGQGNFSFRMATSYFELSDTFGPINYLVRDNDKEEGYDPFPDFYTKFGLQVDAKVEVTDFAFAYGVTDRLELDVDIPITVVDAQARQISAVVPPGKPGAGQVFPQASLQDLETALNQGDLVLESKPFSKLSGQKVRFNGGTHPGVGRIGVGAKVVAYSFKYGQVAFAPEFFFPSPNQDEFAGPDSGAVFPRIVAGASVVDPAKLYMDVGYNYDYEISELRRFVWSLGVSAQVKRATLDFGIGGSHYQTPIRWTPQTAQGDPVLRGSPDPNDDQYPNGLTLKALESNKLGTNIIDLRLGAKARVTDQIVVSGVVSVPQNKEGFRPDAVGTLGVEVYY